MSEWGTAAGLVPIVVVECHLLGVWPLAAWLAWLKELSNVEDLLGCLVVLSEVAWCQWPLLGLPGFSWVFMGPLFKAGVEGEVDISFSNFVATLALCTRSMAVLLPSSSG